MPLKIAQKINFKLFIPISVGLTAFFSIFCKGQAEVITHWAVYIAVLINFYMLHTVVRELIVAGKGQEKPDKFIMFAYSLGKLLVLFGALSLGVLFMGNRIIIPVLNYAFQIFALCASFLYKGE
tara:strand:+ start:10357 stop:10728 length:372 start_codon:yes stop_codon:yes gene_type:complete